MRWFIWQEGWIYYYYHLNNMLQFFYFASVIEIHCLNEFLSEWYLRRKINNICILSILLSIFLFSKLKKRNNKLFQISLQNNVKVIVLQIRILKEIFVHTFICLSLLYIFLSFNLLFVFEQKNFFFCIITVIEKKWGNSILWWSSLSIFLEWASITNHR
jgi:hypothetical protein